MEEKATFTDEAIQNLRNILVSPSEPLAKRFRALFTLRAAKDDRAVAAICDGFGDKSALLKHELAYVLGQMQNPSAVGVLASVLNNVDENPMVRHEAGEALGAIGTEECLRIVRERMSDPEVVVAETCQIAVAKIMADLEEAKQTSTEPTQPSSKTVDEGELIISNAYLSVDPAPPAKVKDVKALESLLLDKNSSLYERYKGLFGLRNNGSEEAVLAICKGFSDSSALFRHELAYVLGQMQHPASAPALRLVLENPDEADMVRHEAAEALGSLATEEVMPLLEKYATDSQDVVRESCLVALDIVDYEMSGSFQYADGLQQQQQQQQPQQV